ncbi:MAG: sensor histidine kinase [Halobacterium sp.]
MGVSTQRTGRRQLLAGAAVVLLGLCLFAVPAYDVYDDTTDLEWSLLATLAENATLFASAGAVTAGGVWLTRPDWDAEGATTVATATVLGTAVTAAVFAWIVVVQEWAMHALKPYVIAMDAVLVGALASFAVGVYRARSARRRRALQTERNRLAGLFENTGDAVATLELGEAGGVDAAATNDYFDDTFESVQRVLDAAAAAADTTPEALLDADRADGTTELELAYGDGDDARDFLVRFVPYDTAGGRTYLAVLATDITEQKQLARERDAAERLELLHEFASDLERAASRKEACELVVDAIDEVLAPESVRAVIDDETVAERHSGTTADGVDAASPDETAAVGDRGRIDVHGDVAARESETIALLATHLDRALERLDRERELADEREELDFINRTLRHNLLNDIQVVRARLETLEAEGETLDDHRDVLVDALDRMADFVQTMRSYTKTLVEDDDHVLGPVDLRTVLSDVTQSVRDTHGDAEVTVGDIPDVAVLADELLDPVFDNILKNAVEHNDKETPRVHVDAERHGDWVTVRVADNGPGVPDSRKETVFERGERGDHSPGSGFGLFLVGNVLESYGGGVELLDNEPTGTVVRVTLPVAGD